MPDLEACSAFGKTPGEALAEVELATAAELRQQEGPASRYRSPGIAQQFMRSGRECTAELRGAAY
jgi:hypothetical protein